MNCLVVTAHPLGDSLSAQACALTTAQLRARGHVVVVDDLYAQAFDPVMSADERAAYRGVYHPRDAGTHVQNLVQAELLVLVFPTWWFGFPAILKGWFDRVWGPGIAFDSPDPTAIITPRLERLQRVIVVTTLGSPWWMDRLVMRRPVRRVLKRAILEACARPCRLDFVALHGADAPTDRDVARFFARIRKAIDRSAPLR